MTYDEAMNEEDAMPQGSGSVVRVVAWEPRDNKSSMGGFDWHYSEESAQKQYDEYKEDETHNYFIFPALVTDSRDKMRTTTEIDATWQEWSKYHGSKNGMSS